MLTRAAKLCIFLMKKAGSIKCIIQLIRKTLKKNKKQKYIIANI